VVVWESNQDGSLSGIFGQRYSSAGSPLGGEFRVNTYTLNVQVLPAVASDSSGNFVVIWHGVDGSVAGVFGQRFASSGAPLGPEFRVNTSTTGLQGYPAVAADPAGNFVVVWLSYHNAPSFQIFAQRYDGAGAPLGPEFRVDTSTAGPQYLNHPAVASDGSGNFVVVWEDLFQDGSSFGIFAQRYAGSGAPLGVEFRVNTFTPASQRYPAVASHSAGSFVVVWESATQDGSYFGVFGQRYASSGADVGPEFRINTFTTGDQRRGSVAYDSSGNFVVAWYGDLQDNWGYGVFGQRYASTGAPLGPEFRINTFTTQNQESPSVTADAAGNFVVVWHSDTQDGSSVGVFGQRYAQIVPVELMRFGVE
jgi:hypothetical protein